MKTLVRWTFPAACAVMTVLVVGGDLILGLFGPGFERGYGALLVLAGGFTLSAALAPVPAILNVSGYQDVVTWASIGVVAVTIAAGILLISQFVIMGAALTTALSASLLRASVLGIVWRRLGILGIIAPPAFAPKKGRATRP